MLFFMTENLDVQFVLQFTIHKDQNHDRLLCCKVRVAAI